MINQSQSFEAVNFNQNDLNTFKNLIVIFFIFKIGGILFYLFRPVISAIIYDIGTIFLILGIYLLSKKYQQLVSGFKIAVLFILTAISELILAELDNLYPHSSHSTTQALIVQLQNIANNFGTHLFIIIVMVLVTGILTLVTAYFFTGWINQVLQTKKSFKLYLYFGIVLFVSELFTGFGYFLYSRAVDNLVNNNTTLTTTDLRPIALPGLIIVVGTILILAAFITEIIAGIKIYTNVNKIIKEKIPFTPVVSNGNLFCRNCGSKLENGAKLCHNCGLKVE